MIMHLEQFRRMIGWNPWHFWGLANTAVPEESGCDMVLRQYNWQDADAVSRAELIDKIELAERLATRELGYAPAPHYIVDEVQPYPRYFESGLVRAGSADAAGRIGSIKLNEGYVQAIGAETHTLIATATLTYSDEDDDGLEETFTASFATGESDPARIVAYIAVKDRLDGEGLLDTYRVHLNSVAIVNGRATVTGRKWLCVKPVRYERAVLSENATSGALDPATKSNFVSALEFYSKTYDGNNQATLVWEAGPYPGWACACAGSISTDPAAIATATARVGIRNAKLGLVIPGQAVLSGSTWVGASFDGCRAPDRVIVRYQAGYPVDPATKQIDPRMAAIVARLALAELGRPICACNDRVTNREVERWQADLAKSGEGQPAYQITAEELNNPFGTKAGHVDAWRQIKTLRTLHGFAIG